ncbi:tRNA(m(1)G37)methyltransferase [Onygenales sp. PD_10]|nr:tRNA(m(1)G37)methyltransferase [Onygenales sp. PD_10]
MFRPPVNRLMRTLDRSFFKKTIPLTAASFFDKKSIGLARNRLEKSKDIIKALNIIDVRTAPNGDLTPKLWNESKGQSGTARDAGRKCVLLREGIKADDPTTWSPTVTELVQEKIVELEPYNMLLDYDYFKFEDILEAILPEELVLDAPSGFTQVDHIAHFNLRPEYLPYKYMIGEIVRDKHVNINTVINKIHDVGQNSIFRTFDYEVLAGPDNLNVTISEQGCHFSFDYGKVYWNTRLSTEHERMVSRFNEGDAVCDAMAGVGPFAVPAGKKKVFVFANDLNPHCVHSLETAARKTRADHLNKVNSFVHAFNINAREFITLATQLLYRGEPIIVETIDDAAAAAAKIHVNQKSKNLPTKTLVSPPTFDHYVMNLPASAVDFLDAFIGIYAGQEGLFQPHTDRRLPLVHVYTFSSNSDEQKIEPVEICQRISKKIGFTITPEDPEVEMRPVRLVAPTKMMYCATFRLPEEVAFKKRVE